MAETEQTTSGSPSIAYEYVWLGGQPVAQIDTATSTPHWTFTDHLGTPILQTDATGAVDWRAEYEPYEGTCSAPVLTATNRCDCPARRTIPVKTMNRVRLMLASAARDDQSATSVY